MLFCFRYCYDIFFCLAYWQFTILRSGELDTFQLSSIDFSCNFDTTIIWLFSKYNSFGLAGNYNNSVYLFKSVQKSIYEFSSLH